MNLCKFEKLQKYVSYDGGHSWEALAEYMKGDIIESASTDCYVCPILYDWRVVQGEFVCDGTTKRELLQKYESYDCGHTYTPTIPSEFMNGNVIETGSTDCGYIPPQYRWVMTPNTRCVEAEFYYREITSSTCDNAANKYKITEYQVSYDSGTTWTTTSTTSTLIEEDSAECGYRTRSISTATTCVGYDKYQLTEYQESRDYGQTWTTTGTSPTTLIEEDSEDCGYHPPYDGKFKATYSDGTIREVECDVDWLSTNDTKPSGYEYSAMTTAIIGDCVVEIQATAFSSCSSLSSVTIPNSVTMIGGSTFSGCESLVSIVLPKHLEAIEGYTFSSCSSLTSITIPNSVSTIENSICSFCSSLSSVVIGSGVTSIGDSAFIFCGSLASVTVNATTPPTLGSDVFKYTASGLKIYVPSGSVNAYKAAWSTYANNIQSQ